MPACCRGFFLFAALPMLLVLALVVAGCAGSDDASPDLSEQVARNNILGTALLGQQNWSEAEAAFREALTLQPDAALLHNNLGVSLMQQGRNDEAAVALDTALANDPGYPWAHYNLGLIQKNDGRFAEAAEHFLAVAEKDPNDLMTQYNLGITLSRIDRPGEAERALRRALELNPTHVSSLYGLGRFLLQQGRRDEGTQLVTLSQEVRARSGLDDAVGLQYGEQGPYAMGVDYPGDLLAPPPAIVIRFAPDPARSLTPAGAGPVVVAPTVFGPDDAPALLVAGSGTLARVSGAGTEELTPPSEGAPLALVAVDLDDADGVDVAALLAGPSGPELRIARGDGEWVAMDLDASVMGRNVAPSRVAMTAVDRDHDGDVDLFACWAGSGPARSGCLLATNDGSGTFTVSGSKDHGFEFSTPTDAFVGVTFSDVDNDRDVDLLAAGPDGVHVFSNLRDGTFREVTVESGIGQDDGVRAFVVADLDKDGWMDVIVAGRNGVTARYNRNGRFAEPVLLGTGAAATSALLLDADNDGFLDVVHGSENGIVLLRNAGSGTFVADVEATNGAATSASAQPTVALDLDGDGDLDLATLDGRTSGLLTNDGGNANHWIQVRSRGIADNRFGVGTKVEVLAGALRQKFEVSGPLQLHAGLGSRESVESLRYLWPGGVLQDEIRRDAGERAIVEQLDRKGTSCPLLYAWRNGRWHFVTDFLGGAAVGNQLAPGVFGVPDTDEYVKIEGGLTEDSGELRLRMNNQLEEVLWFDRTELVVVDHPVGTTVFADEALMPGPPWPEFRLLASPDVRPVRAARSLEAARDRTSTLAERDRDYVKDFELLPFKGYAEPHTLELDLGRIEAGQRVVLLLDGWIDYADSTSNLAASQAAVTLVPPRLSVADGNGGWNVIPRGMGFPAGLPKTMTVDLTGRFPSDDLRVRIHTNMRIYWDRARVMVGGESTPLSVTRVPTSRADLRFGGFPRPTSPDGKKPFVYDPERVDRHGGWKAHVGDYTAFGDVTERLAAVDDDFVTTLNGDEIELRFASPEPVAPGFTRTYLLYADGFGKDMDPNSAAPLQVEPVPFHGQTSYPYPASEAPPRPQHDGPGGVRRVTEHPRGWSGARPSVLVSRD